MKKICKTCGKELPLDDFRIDKHGYLGRKAHCKSCMSKKQAQKKYISICQSCGNEFESSNKKAKYCKYCRYKEHSKKMTGKNHPNYNGGVYAECDTCGKIYHITLSRYSNYNHHFCSKECYSKWQSDNMRGENNPSYNPELTDEYRKQYKEDKRVGSDMDSWRNKVYERDNYTCQCCGDNKSGNLNAHHLNGYNWDKEHRHDVNNGVTLCKSCHKEFHRIYGCGNNTKEQYNKFINNKNKSAS